MRAPKVRLAAGVAVASGIASRAVTPVARNAVRAIDQWEKLCFSEPASFDVAESQIAETPALIRGMD